MRKLVFVLAYVVLAAVACTPAQFSKEVLGDGGGQDGKAADVATPHTCPAETPSQSKGTAESCSCDRECRTGFCADGVCCNMACGQTCMACNLPNSLGVCAAVPGTGCNPAMPVAFAGITVVTPMKFVPVMVTVWPPVITPDFGATLGAGHPLQVRYL